MSINIASYATLNTYTVLSASALTTVNTTTITNGSYAAANGTYSGNLVGTLDQGNAGTAQTELTSLINAINGLGAGTTISGAPGNTTVTYTPGIYRSATTIVYNPGTNIILDAQGNSNAQFFFIAGTAISFTTVSSITLVNEASTCNIFWLAYTEAISFDASPPLVIPGIFVAKTAITFAAGSQVVGRTYAQTAISFTGTSSVNGICTTNPLLALLGGDVVCYLKGSLILTKQGFLPIENIKAGDKVVTKGKIYKNEYVNEDAKLKLEPVMWISKFRVKDLNTKSRPICIEKDALGKNSPFQNLYVSPNHNLLLNGKMVMAKKLVNGKTIYQDNECNDVEYYHLECDSHSAIFANGVLAESYYGGSNRNMFENSGTLRRRFDFKQICALKYN